MGADAEADFRQRQKDEGGTKGAHGTRHLTLGLQLHKHHAAQHGHIRPDSVVLDDFSTFLSQIDRPSRQNKQTTKRETSTLKHTVDHVDHVDTLPWKTFH